MKLNYVDLKGYVRPINSFMKILGIPLILHRSAINTGKYRLLRVWGWLLFAIHIGSTIYNFYPSKLSPVVALKFSITSTMFWAKFILQFSLVIFKWISHLKLLLFVGSSRQLEMWKLIRGLRFHGLKVRPLSIVTLTILLLVINERRLSINFKY